MCIFKLLTPFSESAGRCRQELRAHKNREYKSNTMTKVVLVSTSAPELKGHKTGLWIEELAAPY